MVSELRNLTKPAKIIAVVLAVLFAVSGFLVRDTYLRFSGTEGYARAEVARLDKDKLDKAIFYRQCDVISAELAQKADRDRVEVVQKRLDQILLIMLDPTKKDAVRIQIQAEKANR